MPKPVAHFLHNQTTINRHTARYGAITVWGHIRTKGHCSSRLQGKSPTLVLERVTLVTMEIGYSNKLIHYLKRKGITNLKVSLAETAVESGLVEILIEPLPDDRIEDLYNEKYRYVHVIPGGEELGGDIYVTSRGVEFDETVFFTLSSFFGLKHITARGVHAFRLR